MRDTPLAEDMRALAAAEPEHGDRLRDAANALDAMAAGFYATPQTCTAQQLLGAWARARRLWCDVTGESLV